MLPWAIWVKRNQKKLFRNCNIYICKSKSNETDRLLPFRIYTKVVDCKISGHRNGARCKIARKSGQPASRLSENGSKIYCLQKEKLVRCICKMNESEFNSF